MIFNDTGIQGFDVSFYQDNNSTSQQIDFSKMKSYGADFVIIKSGQRNYLDPDFVYNWREAKAAGIPRAAYWFYDPRESPITQARLFWDSVKNDLPEGRLWVDLEFSPAWGGAYQGWENWKAMLEELKRVSNGFRIGVYTANWWWQNYEWVVDNAYFGTYPLWVAQYINNPDYVTLPKPWSRAMLWQDGTPTIGLAVGVESLEIDHNKFNGTLSQFQDEFGGVEIPPIGEPQIMKCEMKAGYSVNFRTEAGAIIGQLRVGDVVYGEIAGTRPRVSFSKIYRASGVVQELGAIHNAVTTDGGNVSYMLITADSEPVPDPVPTGEPFTLSVEGFKPFTGTLEPL